MTTADYVLIVSIFSACIALFGLGWNIWSRLIYPKARVKVSFYTCAITMGDGPPWPRFVCLSATNFGPTDVTIQSVAIVISRGFGRTPQHALVNPIHNINQPDIAAGPFAGSVPKKLGVGEGHNAYFPFDAGSSGEAISRGCHSSIISTESIGRRCARFGILAAALCLNLAARAPLR